MSRPPKNNSRRNTKASRELIGRDLARVRVAPHTNRRLVLMLFGVALAIGLSLAALRIDILRLRYAMAEAVGVEKSLIEERSALLARVAGLRDPARLEKLARERKMERPESVIELPRVQLASGARR